MKVRYFIDIINKLLAKGLSQVEIAKTLGMKKQNLSEILGKVEGKQRQNLKDEHLPGLLKLCKAHGLDVKSWSQLGKLIEGELKKK